MRAISVLSAFVAFLAVEASNSSLPTAKVGNTVFQGFYANQIEGFVGIRYGQDTGGQNRFKPPVPYTYNATFVPATDPGPACPQKINNGNHGAPDPFTTYSYVTEISEDCLRLNVWRPNGTTASSKLPVLVYIYGGQSIDPQFSDQRCLIYASHSMTNDDQVDSAAGPKMGSCPNQAACNSKPSKTDIRL